MYRHVPCSPSRASLMAPLSPTPPPRRTSWEPVTESTVNDPLAVQTHSRRRSQGSTVMPRQPP